MSSHMQYHGVPQYQSSPAFEDIRTDTTIRYESKPSRRWKLGDMAFLPLFITCAVLSALSITNLGLISSMVGFLLDQKHHVPYYEVDGTGGLYKLKVLPEHLWTNQGHESNGVAGYGFFLGLFGLYVAWHQRNRRRSTPSKLLLTLIILLILATLFTLSAIIFVNIVTVQTSNQRILESVARLGAYSEYWWTPETWYKAVRDLSLVDPEVRSLINRKVMNMVAWRWMLVPIFVVDVVATGLAAWEYWVQRKGTKTPFEYSIQTKV